MFRLNNLKENRFKVFVILFIGSFSAFILFLSFFVLRIFFINLTYSDVSPNYHSFHKAYIVDENGKGIDSVAVFLKDNSNFNLIYKTFTNSSGEFELFNDFHSFALLNTPTSFELHTYFKGVKDTVIYKFEKYRVSHFKKVYGPDTIAITRSELFE